MSFLLHTPLVGLVIGWIAKALGDVLKSQIALYDRMPAIGKQSAALALSFILVVLAHFGIASPDACSNVVAVGIGSPCLAGLTSPDFLNAIIGALVAIAIKHGEQNSAKA